MTRPAAITSLLVAIAAMMWTVALAVDPGPFAPSSAAAVGIGTVAFGVIAVAGLLLVRGVWVRSYLTVYLLLMAGLGVTLPLGPITAAALAVTAAAAVGAWGPWLTGWFRRRAAAGRPPWQASALGMAGLALVPLVGVASPSGLEPAHGILAGAGLFFGWAYIRTHVWGLWGLRLLIAAVAIAAAAVSPVAGAVALVAAAAGITWLAWTKPAMLAVRPLMDRLPGPRVASPKEETPT